MPVSLPDHAYALLESSFKQAPSQASPKSLPRKRDELYSVFPAANPLKPVVSFSDDETCSQASLELEPLESPGVLKEVERADTGLPPTPPSNSEDHAPAPEYSAPPHADGVVSSLTSKTPVLSTPVNQRSPPTPDPSPPRTATSHTSEPMQTLERLERPPLYPYASSRAESFTTAREDLSSDAGGSRTHLPLEDRLSTVEEDRGLGLAFEGEDDNTPTERKPRAMEHTHDKEERPALGYFEVEDLPDREWDTNLMRNVTMRRKRASTSPRKPKNLDALDTASSGTNSTVRQPRDVRENANGSQNRPRSPSIENVRTNSKARQSTNLRERVDESKNSPQTPSIENFAQSIAWPSQVNTMLNNHIRDSGSKRLSVGSATSTVVEAMVIVTPPQRQRTLRHTGKNLALRSGDSSTERSPVTNSNRNSLNSDDLPLHRLVHKKSWAPDKRKRQSVDSQSSTDPFSAPTSAPRREYDYMPKSSTPLRVVSNPLQSGFQPSNDESIRPHSMSRRYRKDGHQHKRIVSDPEATRPVPVAREPRTFLELSAPESPRRERPSYERPSTPVRTRDLLSATSPTDSSPTSLASPRLRRRKRVWENLSVPSSPNLNKSLPQLPKVSTENMVEYLMGDEEIQELEQEYQPVAPEPVVTKLQDSARNSLTKENLEQAQAQAAELQKAQTPQRTISSGTVPTIKEPSSSPRGRSSERRPSLPHERSSNSKVSHLTTTTEELPRQSADWVTLRPEDHRRVSFDSTSKEEHAMARHLYSQNTPFSQMSAFSESNELEVSEATAVSIYPHNNNSLLVVQQVARSGTLPTRRQISASSGSTDIPSSPPSAPSTIRRQSEPTPSQPQTQALLQPPLPQPILTIEPSTPPTQQALLMEGITDSPLKNPRAAPAPPIIKFIPPTPLDELDRQLAPSPSRSTHSTRPGPPLRTESRPVRRLSLVQRARRYSEDLIGPLLARGASVRVRGVSDGRIEKRRVPSVNEEDGSLHPFWRPRGFWEGFEDESDSDGEDVLPAGGDTSDVEEEEDDGGMGVRRLGSLGRRLTGRGRSRRVESEIGRRDGEREGFLIGNSVGLERAGTNRRKPQISLPRVRSLRHRASKPKIMLQAPTFPLRSSTSTHHSNRIEKRSSHSSLRSSASRERPPPRRVDRRRDEWKKGKSIPGFRGMQVQYIGLSGVREKMRERKERKVEAERERRREELRGRIGKRVFVEDPNVP